MDNKQQSKNRKRDEALEEATKALDAGSQSSDANAGGTSGLGSGSGYDVAGQAAVQPAPPSQAQIGSHETSGLGQDTGRGRGSDPAGGAANTGGGGTGGMTGVGGGKGSTGNIVGGNSGISHGSEMTPVAGGVAVPGGRGSDVGDADHSYGGAPSGYSGGTTGGSDEKDLGGGLSGGMRSGTGIDVSGGIGGSRNPGDEDPTDGSADVVVDKNRRGSPAPSKSPRPLGDMKRDSET